MRISNVRASRPDWYDRNPAGVAESYLASAVVPHALTERWIYTIPTGKKAAIQILYLNLIKDSTATVGGLHTLDVAYTPSGGVELTIFYVAGILIAAGERQNAGVGATMVLLAGDLIRSRTQDLSIGGSNIYATMLQGLEIDA